MEEARHSNTGFADINGARLYYEVAGAGQPLVLIHAGIADSRMWDDQFDVFAEHYRVVRFDARGFGNSSMPAGAFSYSEDLYELLRFLEIERAYVLGVSMGGGTAIDLALAHPEIVAALIPVASALDGYAYAEDPKEAEIEAAASVGDYARANELELQLWVDGPKRSHDQVDAAMRERVRIMNLNNYTLSEQNKGERRRLDPPAITRLGDIRVPTLIIVGDYDIPDMLAIADVLEQGISESRKVVMHGVAHLPNMERPKEFNKIVVDFLSAV